MNADDERAAALSRSEANVRNAYDLNPVSDIGDAQQLARSFFEAIFEGKTASAREVGFAFWILWPVIIGDDDPRRLPFRVRGRGQRRTSRNIEHGLLAALQVQQKREAGMTKDQAIAEVAGNESKETSLRGIYQRLGPKRLKEILKKDGTFFLSVADKIAQSRHSKSVL